MSKTAKKVATIMQKVSTKPTITKGYEGKMKGNAKKVSSVMVKNKSGNSNRG